jgi:hypothetical protein
MKRYLALTISAVVGLSLVFGCGGGGGGGAAPADVIGRILLVSTGSTLQGATVSIEGKNATTDANGHFLLQGVPSSATQIAVSATGIKSLTQPLPALVPNTTNDLADIFVLDSSATGGYTATASGTVVRSDTQAPVSGAAVKLNGQVVITNNNGSFAFNGLPVGLGGADVQVGLIKAKATDILEDKQIFFDPPLGASPPNNDLGLIEMSPPVGPIPGLPSNIRGVITLQGLVDLSGTLVTLIDKSNGSTVATFTTAADGKYGFFVVAGAYTVKASRSGFHDKSQDVTLVRPDLTQTLSFTLIP